MGTRNPFEAPEVASRRGGPVKRPLSRELIVSKALGQLARDGLEGMSLRKVAAGLETGPASLYAYVEDLRELQALVLDRALASVDLSHSRRGWRARLTMLLESYLQVLSQSPGLAQLAMSTIAVGPHALRIIETLLELLDEAGVDRATSAWAADLLLLYVTAIAAEHSGGEDPAAPGGAVARAIRGASAQSYPRVHATREELLSGSGEARFAWAIEALVSGILRTARPPHFGSGKKASKKKPARKRSARAG